MGKGFNKRIQKIQDTLEDATARNELNERFAGRIAALDCESDELEREHDKTLTEIQRAEKRKNKTRRE